MIPNRGVYTAPHLSIEGHPIKLAIASDGRRIAEREVTGDASAVSRELWAELEAVAPQDGAR